MWGSVFVTFISLGIVWSYSQSAPWVATEFGIYQGVWAETNREIPIASFLGIPYAKEPVGRLRFQKPEPFEDHWRNRRNATVYRGPCLSLEVSGQGSEDCLYLNIFTQQKFQNSRKELNKTKRAVMVYVINDIFGNNNNSLYKPDDLLEHDVVLVTVNYRLDFFGFFTTGNEVAPGNYGLKDVLEALRWLQRNIAAFGGDPNRVTLMGHGLGAGVVHLLALSEKSEDLFHRYVTQSGAAHMPWSYRSRSSAVNASLDFAASLNCTRETMWEIVECLRNIKDFTSEEIDREIFKGWNRFGPMDELESDEAVVTDHPITLMREGKARDIPWLTGVVADEGLMLTILFLKNESLCHWEVTENFEEIANAVTNCKYSVKNTTAYVDELLNFYFGNNVTINCSRNFIEFAGDAVVNWPVYNAVSIQSKHMTSPVYFYKFNYGGTFTASQDYGYLENPGVSHEDDLNYLFSLLNELYASELQLNDTASDSSMKSYVTEMWTNFAKNGTPILRYMPEWKRYQDGHGYNEFTGGPNFTMQDDFFPPRMNFLTDLNDKQLIIPNNSEDPICCGSGRAMGPQCLFNTALVLLLDYLIAVIFAR
ncbi:venom carboxylesterase-6-like [Diprion similis]|uniref:venom carboxylesterase-6-like n=1 Tax=Diprion similis TaxID=362088 RepID=UPI001EF85E5F|nr:venom carboxylesterase-6-like [Diprion similis]